MTRWNLWLWFCLLHLAGCATNGDPRGEVQEVASVTATAPAVAEKSAEQLAQEEAQREALVPVLDLMRAGEWMTARELAQELILAHPMLAAAYANMGNIHLQLGDGDKAEQAWLKALELRPVWAAVYNQLGLYYREQGRFEQALAAYQQALAADEGYAKAHRNLAILYEIYLGDGDKALPHYRRYQALSSNVQSEVELWVADLERRVGRGGE